MNTLSPSEKNATFLSPKHIGFVDTSGEKFYFLSESKVTTLPFKEGLNIDTFEQMEHTKSIFPNAQHFEGYRLLLIFFGLLSFLTLAYSIVRIAQLIKSCPTSYKNNLLPDDPKVNLYALQSSLC